MKLFDRLMDLNPDLAAPGNPHYDRYNYSAGLIQIGWAAIAAGLEMNNMGLDIGLKIAVAGTVLQTVGGAVVATEVPHLDFDLAQPRN